MENRAESLWWAELWIFHKLKLKCFSYRENNLNNTGRHQEKWRGTKSSSLFPTTATIHQPHNTNRIFPGFHLKQHIFSWSCCTHPVCLYIPLTQNPTTPIIYQNWESSPLDLYCDQNEKMVCLLQQSFSVKHPRSSLQISFTFCPLGKLSIFFLKIFKWTRIIDHRNDNLWLTWADTA